MSGVIKRGKIVRADLANYDGRNTTYTRPDATGGTISGLPVGNDVDVLSVYGGGTARNDATIRAALGYIGAGVARLSFAPGTWTIDESVTIPSTLPCHVAAGCVFNVASGKTLTFNTSVDVDYPASWKTGAGTVSATLSETCCVSVKDFGAVGDGVTDDWAAIRAALDSGAVRIYFPALAEGLSYYSTKCFNLNRRYYLFGDHGVSENGAGSPRASRITFADNTCGFVVHRYNTGANDSGYSQAIISPVNTHAADNTVISDLQIRRGTGSDTTIDGVTHGIRLRARAILRNLNISGFAGNGIHVVATAGGTAETEGNANLFVLENIRIINCWHGVFVDGPDANAGSGSNLDVSSNAGWGIFDSSFLGNTWIACHASGNGLGAYKTDNANARSVFLGCYEESGYAPSSIISPSIHVGGLSDVGNGSAPQLANLCGTQTEYVPNRTSVNLVTITAAGSGYTSAPAATFDAPTGASTATATATIGSGYLSGKILKIAITSGGAGYSSAPTVTIGGDGSGATATAEIEGGVVQSITVVPEGGSGYTTAPVTISAPTQTTALGTAYLNSAGGVAYIVVTNRGSGYTAAPGISLSGGGGSGATATCTLATASRCLVTVNGLLSQRDNYTTVLQINRDDSGAPGPWRLKQLAFTGDLLWDHSNSGLATPSVFTGERTAYKFGRSVPVPYVQNFPFGVWLGSSTVGRQLTYAAAMPTSGEYARGDFVMNNTISELGVVTSKYIILGWSRLVTGTAHVLNTDWLEARCLTGN